MMRMMRLVMRMMMERSVMRIMTTVIEMMATLRSPSNVSRLSWRDRYSCSYASSCATFDHCTAGAQLIVSLSYSEFCTKTILHCVYADTHCIIVSS